MTIIDTHGAAIRALVSTADGDTDEREAIYDSFCMLDYQMQFVDSIIDIAVWLLGEAGATHLLREYAKFIGQSRGDERKT